MNETTNEIVKPELSREIAVTDQTPIMPPELKSRLDRLQSDEKLDRYFMEKAQLMAKSPMLPPVFRGDVYGCYALQQLAFQWEMNPVLLAPGIYKAAADAPLSLEGKIVKTLIDKYAPVRDGFVKDEYFGDWDRILGKFETRTSRTKTDKYGNPSVYKVPAWKPEDEEGLGIRLTAELRSGHTVVYELRLTQCLTRNSTLWAEDPQLQIFYRAIARFARKYFPGLLGGLYIKEEIIDEHNTEIIDITPKPSEAPKSETKTATQSLKERLGVKPKETDVEKPSAEPPKAKEPEAPKESLAQKIDRIIAEKNAPVTLADVLKYINAKSPMKIVTMGDLEKTYKGKMYDDTEALVDHAAEWAEGIGNAEQQ